MFEQDLVGTLAFVTLGIGLIVALVLFLRFMRKPQNRHPMDGHRERNIAEIRADAGEPEVRNDKYRIP